MNDTDPILVIGAGAIGSFLALRLSSLDNPMLLLARGARLLNLQTQGLRVSIGQSVVQKNVPVAAAPVAGVEAGLVIICTKMSSFAEALELAAPAIGPRTVLLTVQNGVDAPAMAAARFPDAAILASRVHGFFELAGDEVRHVGVEPSLELGAIGPDPRESAAAVADLLKRAGIQARVSASIETSLWQKFLLAASLGTVALAYGIPAGEVAHHSEAGTMLKVAMQEVQAVAQARGIQIASADIAGALAFAASFPRTATTSLQRDALSNAGSEYDYLPGAVLRLAKESAIATPGFAQLHEMTKARNGRLN
ncbi:MAG: 2-dehydropantoate 2-reductase [Sphingomonadaceae bacterium]|nr:2-dehydropantoate 2-reductase [Sphingomonadaceae bacterium]